MALLSRTLEDGTRVVVEDNGESWVQIRLQKGGVVRALAVQRDEAATLHELLGKTLPDQSLRGEVLKEAAEVPRQAAKSLLRDNPGFDETELAQRLLDVADSILALKEPK